MKECPFCAEKIQERAIKCKHCGEYLNKHDEVYKEELTNKDENLKTQEVVIENEENIQETTVNNEKEELIQEKIKVGVISKIINFLVYFFYTILSFSAASFYATMSNIGSKNDSNYYSEIGSSMIVMFWLAMWIGIHYYRKNRGILWESTKKNIVQMLKWSIVMTIVIVILFAMGSSEYDIWKSKEYRETKDVLQSFNITDDGVFSYNDSNKNSTEMWKLMNDYIAESTKETNVMQAMIEGYENTMYSDNSFKSKDYLFDSLKNHDLVIAYIEDYKTNWLEKEKQNYIKTFSKYLDNYDAIDKRIDAVHKLMDERLKMYQDSKKLYTFYYENYNGLTIDEYGEIVSVWDDIYNEYEQLWNIYEAQTNRFEEVRLEFVNSIRNKIDSL